MTFNVNNLFAGSNSATVVVSFNNSQAIPAAAAGTLTAAITTGAQVTSATGQDRGDQPGWFPR